ncbi:hypothetical protein F4859DRAFT_324774 [Xylaria cf. heliscus]|nr:hypothetical protein F4859DRAFT_324774 [Xylaria cf. heliscus]
MGVEVAMSAAAKFASIEELLLILAEYVNDRATLWSLCLSSWRFNCVFTSKLSELVVVRIEKDDTEATVQDLIDGLVAGPYLPDLRHLQLIVNNGPAFPENILEIIRKLLVYTPNLKIFTWESADGDIPVSVLVQLSKQCQLVEELHLISGPELNNYGTGFRDVLEKPTFQNVRVLTCRSMGTWHALYIMNQCRSLERVRMTHMGYMLALGWVHSGYHAHLRALIAREEATRSRSEKPLRIEMCYSRSMKANYDCEVCDGPSIPSFKQDHERYQQVWPWASGRAWQYFNNGQVRHITYEYPNPEPPDMSSMPLDE